MSYGSRKELWPRGLCPWGWPPFPAYNVEPVTNTCRRLVRTTNDGRRGECSTLAAVRRGFVFHTSRLVRLVGNTVDLYAVKPDIRPESRFFAYPTCIRRPPLGGFPSEYRHPVWYGKTRMVSLLDGEKNWRYVYSFWHDPRTWQTDGQTDTAWRHRPRLCIASRGKNPLFCNSEGMEKWSGTHVWDRITTKS